MSNHNSTIHVLYAFDAATGDIIGGDIDSQTWAVDSIGDMGNDLVASGTKGECVAWLAANDMNEHDSESFSFGYSCRSFS